MGYGIKSYVLRSGRMSAAQRRSYETLSPLFCAPLAEAPLDFLRVFGNTHPVTLEIGFGMGAATVLIAAENPDKNYLGVEVHRPGIGRLLWEIENRGLANIRIVEADAAEVLEKMIPPGSLAAFHIFFPDPWPKKRHHKRRLIRRPLTSALAEKLSPGGYVYMVTDWADYGDWALAELSATEGLRNAYDGFAPAQEWRPRTRFEQKGMEKELEVRELYFIKEGGCKNSVFETASLDCKG